MFEIEKCYLPVYRGQYDESQVDKTNVEEPYYLSLNADEGGELDNQQSQTVLECSDPSVVQAFLQEGGELPSYLPPGTQIIIETKDG